MKTTLLLLFILLVTACERETFNCEESDCFPEMEERNFKMGFTTWNYAPGNDANENTYQFILNNGDIYAEQIDEYIPWNSWIANAPLPEDFLLKMQYKVSRRPSDIPLSLSISFLNTDRDQLLPDRDGSVPENEGFDDPKIIDAYEKHVVWLVERFEPEYLVFAMEVNDLFIKDRSKWEDYKIFSKSMRTRLRLRFPDLPMSESITLHSWFEAETNEKALYTEQIQNFLSGLDFAAVSFYAFLKGLKEESGFQRAFDFLHENVELPIAMVETNHLAETLNISSFNLTIQADECEQMEYLQTLLHNAQKEDYEYVIWWSHRDYDELWEIFPEEAKDIGKVWRDTGLLDEAGRERPAFNCWEKALSL